MSPLYVLYDLRVAYSHLGSGSDQALLSTIASRLGIAQDASLPEMYRALTDRPISAFSEMLVILDGSGKPTASPLNHP
jgi:hypothetical protein